MLLLMMVASLGLAQEAPAVPAVPATPAQPIETIAPGSVVIIESPLLEGMREPGDFAWVHVINLSGNAGNLSFEFVTADSAGVLEAPEGYQNLAYGGHGDYAAFPSGRYHVNLLDGQGANVYNQEVTLDGGRYYTLALIGLQVPPDVADAEATESNFMTWLRGVFGNDEHRYNLKLLVLQDDLNRTVAANSALVRVVNAAPGTEGVSLAEHGASSALTGVIDYGNAGNYKEIDLATLAGPLELRIGGSAAATVDLSSAQLQPGTVNTVFAVGTPTEETPLRAIILSSPALGD
jgi:hypothetical protein